MKATATKSENKTTLSSITPNNTKKTNTPNSDRSVLQTKLTIGEPNDRYEQEADSIADKVMTMPDPGTSIQRKCTECEEEPIQMKTISSLITPWVQRQIEEEEPLLTKPDKLQITPWIQKQVQEEEPVQTKLTDEQSSQRSVISDAQFHSSKCAGKPLSESTRNYFEPRFGKDFSNVRIHTCDSAVQMNKELNAQAFTHKNNIFFNQGKYNPVTSSGKKLIAHELTHTIQQGSSSHRPFLFPKKNNIISKTISKDLSGSDTIRRVKWYPNLDTGKDKKPWPTKPYDGDVLIAQTDSGNPIETWRPHDKKTYWCHGFTFGGKTAPGGPYSTWGRFVQSILTDDGWKPTFSCLVLPNDILIFYNDKKQESHSGIVRSVTTTQGSIDEASSKLESKWGDGPHGTRPWEEDAKAWGKYSCFSKSPKTGVCTKLGPNEIGSKSTGKQPPKSVIHDRIDVRAQFAFQRLFRSKSPQDRIDAIDLFYKVDSGEVRGIYGDDLGIAAQIAAKRGTVRWKLVPPGQDAVWMEDEMPDTPVIIFKASAGKKPRLDQALLFVYRTRPQQVTPPTPEPDLPEQPPKSDFPLSIPKFDLPGKSYFPPGFNYKGKTVPGKAPPPYYSREGCECDCESYCGDIAFQYLWERRTCFSPYKKYEPSEFKQLSGYPKCNYTDTHPPPCTWACTTKYRYIDRLTGYTDEMTIGVILVNSQNFLIGMRHWCGDTCWYSFICPPEGGLRIFLLSCTRYP